VRVVAEEGPGADEQGTGPARQLLRLGVRPQVGDQLLHVATGAGEQVDYLQADVYSAPEALAGRTFDLVRLARSERAAHLGQQLVDDQGGRRPLAGGRPPRGRRPACGVT
jgi:hypothetical protein